eukprot:2964690-Pyramimonas_sp.AAC.1
MLLGSTGGLGPIGRQASRVNRWGLGVSRRGSVGQAVFLPMAARCSGVQPLRSTALTHAPTSSSTATTPGRGQSSAHATCG